MITLSSVARDYGIDIKELRRLNPGVCDNEPFNSINDITMPANWYKENGYNMTDKVDINNNSKEQTQPKPQYRTQNQQTVSSDSKPWYSEVLGAVTEFASDIANAFKTETNPYTGKKEGFFDKLGKEFKNVMDKWKQQEDQLYNR